MNILFLFEFGFPQYRTFIIDYYSKENNKVLLVSADDKFSYKYGKDHFFAKKIWSKNENVLYYFSPKFVFNSDVVITTMNLRRPHTWLYVLIFPYKKWIFWGQAKWSNNSVFFRLLRKLLLTISSGYVVYTPEGRSNLISVGYPEHKITISYNTIYVSNSKMTYGKDYLLYFGRVQRRKEVELILPYLKDIGLRLRIVGDGQEKSYIYSLARKHNVLSLVDFFPGTFDDKEILNHFSGAIAYYSPGHVGLGVVQSFAYGVPVITLKSKEHAPEFYYLSSANSYIYDSLGQLVVGLENLVPDGFSHLDKKKSCFDFFNKNLSVDNYFSAFDFHINKVYGE